MLCESLRRPELSALTQSSDIPVATSPLPGRACAITLIRDTQQILPRSPQPRPVHSDWPGSTSILSSFSQQLLSALSVHSVGPRVTQPAHTSPLPRSHAWVICSLVLSLPGARARGRLCAEHARRPVPAL